MKNLAIREPAIWEGAKSDYVFESSFSIRYPSQTWVITTEVFKGNSRLIFFNVKQDGFIILLTAEDQDNIILFFKIEEMQQFQQMFQRHWPMT